MSKSKIINSIGLLFLLIYILTHHFYPLPNIFEGILSIGGFVLVLASIVVEDREKKEDLK